MWIFNVKFVEAKISRCSIQVELRLIQNGNRTHTKSFELTWHGTWQTLRSIVKKSQTQIFTWWQLFAHLLYKLSYIYIVVCNLRSKTRNRNHSREKFLISMLYPNIFNRQISKQAAFGAMEWNSWFWKLKQTCMKCQGNLLIAIEIGTFKLTFGSKILHWCSDIFRYFVLKMSEKEAIIRLECQKYTQNLIKLWFSER